MDFSSYNDGYDSRLAGMFHMPFKYRSDGETEWIKGWKEADADMKRWNPSIIVAGIKITYWFPEE